MLVIAVTISELNVLGALGRLLLPPACFVCALFCLKQSLPGIESPQLRGAQASRRLASIAQRWRPRSRGRGPPGGPGSWEQMPENQVRLGCRRLGDGRRGGRDRSPLPGSPNSHSQAGSC